MFSLASFVGPYAPVVLDPIMHVQICMTHAWSINQSVWICAYMSKIVKVGIDILHKFLQTLLKNLSEEVGTPVKIGSFLRVEVGEGLQR